MTGATGGLGYEIALALAQGCADVILAGRNESRGRAAAAAIRSLAPRALVRFEKLDLASLASVRSFAARLQADDRPIDLLVNNAGILGTSQRRLTSDGFELHLGTNYLGHFALTGLLLPLLRQGRRPRVVQVSSRFYLRGKIRFDDLNSERNYDHLNAYCQSKLALVLFSRALQLRSDIANWGLLSAAVQPGLARTNLLSQARGGLVLNGFLRPLRSLISQSPADGARAALFAAASPEVLPGGLYGPAGFWKLIGPPRAAKPSRRALDEDVAQRLWTVSEQLTGVYWPPVPQTAHPELK